MGEQASLPVILPCECILSGQERDIVYNTLIPNEFPCLGCFKSKECPIGPAQGFAMAQALGADITPDALKCGRCGAPIIEWTIRGTFRVWKCRAAVGSDAHHPGFYCNWEKSELGRPFEVKN